MSQVERFERGAERSDSTPVSRLDHRVCFRGVVLFCFVLFYPLAPLSGSYPLVLDLRRVLIRSSVSPTQVLVGMALRVSYCTKYQVLLRSTYLVCRDQGGTRGCRPSADRTVIFRDDEQRPGLHIELLLWLRPLGYMGFILLCEGVRFFD